MREIIFRGKRIDNGEWVEGAYFPESASYPTTIFTGEHNNMAYDVKSDTVGQYTGLTDKNGKKIFEGDIVEHNTYDDFNCYSVVKMGKYIQDGSSGEYPGRNCIGVYVEVDNFTCPDWADNDPSCFSEYLTQRNLAEVNAECEVIGNIHDNPELLKDGKDLTAKKCE